MPELPEVETIVRELRKNIIGLKITDFWADREKPFRQTGGIKKFKNEIIGKKIISVTRRAKFIVIDIEGDKAMFVHQKISGHLMHEHRLVPFYIYHDELSSSGDTDNLLTYNLILKFFYPAGLSERLFAISPKIGYF